QAGGLPAAVERLRDLLRPPLPRDVRHPDRRRAVAAVAEARGRGRLPHDARVRGPVDPADRAGGEPAVVRAEDLGGGGADERDRFRYLRATRIDDTQSLKLSSSHGPRTARRFGMSASTATLAPL